MLCEQHVSAGVDMVRAQYKGRQNKDGAVRLPVDTRVAIVNNDVNVRFGTSRKAENSI